MSTGRKESGTLQLALTHRGGPRLTVVCRANGGLLRLGRTSSSTLAGIPPAKAGAVMGPGWAVAQSAPAQESLREWAWEAEARE